MWALPEVRVFLDSFGRDPCGVQHLRLPAEGEAPVV